jgi:rhomboid protease GluP
MMFYRRESFKQFLQRYPIVSVIIALNVLVFIYEWFVDRGVSPASTSYLLNRGSIYPIEHLEGEYYRFFTYAFLHGGLTHLIMNMFFLIIIAPPLEVMVGKARFVLLFLFTVLSTSLFVSFLGNHAGVGASGFTYGILGLYVYIVLQHKGFLDVGSKKIVLIWTVIGWISSLIIPEISVLGHLGGFVGGFVFGWLATRRNSLHHWSNT